jgi:hypothetical protein
MTRGAGGAIILSDEYCYSTRMHASAFQAHALEDLKRQLLNKFACAWFCATRQPGTFQKVLQQHTRKNIAVLRSLLLLDLSTQHNCWCDSSFTRQHAPGY